MPGNQIRNQMNSQKKGMAIDEAKFIAYDRMIKTMSSIYLLEDATSTHVRHLTKNFS